MGSLIAFRSASDAARVALEMVDSGERLSRVWRFAFVQLLDDYDSVLRHQGIAAAASMWHDEPPRSSDSRLDAAFAALAEHLARRDGWAVPAWALDPTREALPWWFVSDLKGMHPRALVESPLSFRRRGVFISRGALSRV